MSHKLFCLATFKNLMEELLGGSYLVMKITPIVTGDRPFMANLYKYNYWKVLVFIATDGSESTDTDDPYLSRFPDNYYNVYICLFFHPCVLVGYFNACNAKDNHNGM